MPRTFLFFSIILCFSLPVWSQAPDTSDAVVSWPTFPEAYNRGGIPESVTKVALSKVDRIPNEIWTYKNLKRIDFFDCPKLDLKKLRKDIEAHPKIVALGFASCSLHGIPDEITSLTQLKALNIVRDTFKTAGKNLEALVNLELLDLGDQFSGGDSITSFDADLSKMKNLRILYLYGNHLQKLPNGIKGLPLVELDIDANDISDIDVVYSFTSLTFLNIMYNNIREISPQLSNLKELKYLYACGNNFTTLPQELSPMDNLKRADLPKVFSEEERKRMIVLFPKAEIEYH